MIQYNAEIQLHREALLKTAEFYAKNAQGIFDEDFYADHVTQEEKERFLKDGLKYAEEVKNGNHLTCFSVAQKFHYILTGESVALLP